MPATTNQTRTQRTGGLLTALPCISTTRAILMAALAVSLTETEPCQGLCSPIPIVPNEESKKKQAEARAKQQAEQHKKEVEAAREQRKQERAEASRYKQEREAQLKQERVEQKQKFDELRNSYWAEKDEKRKKAIMKELKAAAQNYEQKFGKHPDDDKIRTQKRSDEAVKRASEPLSEKLQKGIGRPQDSDKNHPYWKTPEGKAEQYFSQRMAAAEHGTFTHQDKIKSIAEAARKKALSLNSEAAGINQEIDRINRKRKYTKEGEAKVKELNKKRIKAERESTA
ncbi:MAG: hypothetical protein J5915_12590, partial [Acidaminococcaceae bacterium]|nr:hypothetical protein [Acidaminococcaceae bacterium]